MNRDLKTLLIFAAILLIWILIWNLLWSLPDPERIRPIDTPRYHGADAITVGWDGEVTAYKWTGKGYRVMWTRRQAL